MKSNITPENMTRANIAIVLTDIIGSTKFVQQHGAQIAAQYFQKHDRLVLSLISKNNGQWIDNSDGHLMYFANVANAIAFAIEYKEKIKKFPFKSRVGIHYDEMIIIKNNEKLIRGGVKRITIEGLGKNIAARTMSLCNENQILLSHNAYKTYRERINHNKNIPKNVLIALMGLYKFKGVTDPEQIYVLGFEESHLQPSKDSEKAIRLGGANKIKTKFRNKLLKEKIEYLFWRLGFIFICWLLYISWPYISDYDFKKQWNHDFIILKPFEYIDYYIKLFIEQIKKYYL